MRRDENIKFINVVYKFVWALMLSIGGDLDYTECT